MKFPEIMRNFKIYQAESKNTIKLSDLFMGFTESRKEYKALLFMLSTPLIAYQKFCLRSEVQIALHPHHVLTDVQAPLKYFCPQA